LSNRGADVLIVGTSLDPHIDRVIERLPSALGIVRFDVDRFPRDQSLSISIDGETVNIFVDGKAVAGPGLGPSVGWFRRLGRPGLDPNLDKKFERFALAEASHTLEAFTTLLAPRQWINDYWATRRASLKPLQYALAAKVGLSVPPTIFSSSKPEVMAWLSQRPEVVAKTISSPVVFDEDDERGFSFTHVVSEADRENLEDVGVTPVQMQELIEPAFEVRLMSILGQHVAVRIDADRSVSEGVRDWRSERVATRYSWFELPSSIEQATMQLLEELNLDYAASDFIVDRNGRFHFLEANPHGAWLWLEDALGEARFTTLFAQAIVDNISEEKLYN